MKLEGDHQVQSSSFTGDGMIGLPQVAVADDVTRTPYLSNLSRALVIVPISIAAGLAIAVFWSFELADTVIGASIARTALGAEAKDVEIGLGGPLFSILFTFVVGLAATFTACNCVVFSCMVPLFAQKNERQASITSILGWMILGVLLITAVYGAAGAILGQAVPALSTATLAIGNGYPLRLAQSTVIFTILGAIFFWWGLTSLGLVPNPLAWYAAHSPWFKPLALGILVGFFTVGRPYGLFQKAFAYTAEVGNPALGALAIALQGLGNILLVVVITLFLAYGTGGRFERWMRNHPHSLNKWAAASMIVGGIFFMAYWGLRVPSYFGIGWFPHMPYR